MAVTKTSKTQNEQNKHIEQILDIAFSLNDLSYLFPHITLAGKHSEHVILNCLVEKDQSYMFYTQVIKKHNLNFAGYEVLKTFIHFCV